MLKGIDPLLTPRLLGQLAEMGHGDEIVIADANFTAYSLARGKPVIELPGVGVERVSQAVLSLLPLDHAVRCPVAYMQVSDQPPGFLSSLQRRMLAQVQASSGLQPDQFEAVERFAFYERVAQAFCIVLTGELQPYGNFVFKKGVLGDPLAA